MIHLSLRSAKTKEQRTFGKTHAELPGCRKRQIVGAKTTKRIKGKREKSGKKIFQTGTD